MLLNNVFQPFSSLGTSLKFLIIWRNLNAPYSTIYSIFKEPSKKLAEPRLKNTALEIKLSCIRAKDIFFLIRFTVQSLLETVIFGCKILRTGEGGQVSVQKV